MAKGIATKRGPMTEAKFLASVRLGTVPDEKPKINRDYSSKPSVIPGLNEQVWESYTTGKTMVVGTPAGTEDRIKSELLKAKNYLNKLHRDDEGPKVDIRGLEKSKVQVITDEDINAMSAVERTKYREHVPPGWVGVRYRARPPEFKGRAVEQAKARAAATTRSTGATRAVENGQAEVAAPTAVPVVKFSG